MKIAGYIRVSTDDQELSIDAQRQRIQEYCIFNKYELVDVLIDEGVSGTTTMSERESAKKIFSMMDDKEIQGVASVKLDRMFRSASDALITSELFLKKGVSMHFIDMGGMSINTDTAIGKMMLTMLAGFAEFERNMISERTKAVLQNKKKNGEVYGVLPYGFKEEGGTRTFGGKDGRRTGGEAGKMVVDEERMDIVRNIFQWTSTFSYGKIAKMLNMSEVKSSRGGKWNKSVIYNIAKNDIYKQYLNK